MKVQDRCLAVISVVNYQRANDFKVTFIVKSTLKERSSKYQTNIYAIQCSIAGNFEANHIGIVLFHAVEKDLSSRERYISQILGCALRLQCASSFYNRRTTSY